MLRRFFHSQFFSKLFCELLPATIASAIGAYLINSYFRPTPPAQPAASAEMVQLLRDQQALLADYLKKSTEAHQRADQAVAQETSRLKVAERDAIAALREAKAAELRALAAAVTRAGEASERRLAAKPAAAPVLQPAQAERAQADRSQADRTHPDRAVASEPLQLRQAASAAPQPQAQGPVQPQPQVQAQDQAQPVPPPEGDNGVVAKLKGALSAAERLPSRAFDWFSEAVAPPRPPSDLPPRQFTKAVM